MLNKLSAQFFCFSFLIISNLMSQNITVEPHDEWVIPASMPESSSIDTYNLNGGFYYSLIDTQTHLDEEADYFHTVQDITGFMGVQNASQILINFDPTYQKVHFHQLIIHRKGQRIDRTKEVKFELLNNEGQLASSVYSGDLTGHAILDDIRRGDKIEMAYTIYGNNPIFEQNYFRLQFLTDVVPLDKINIDVFSSDVNGFKYELVNADSAGLVVTKEDKLIHLKYENSNVKASDYDETMHYSEMPFGYLNYYNQNSWTDVQAWAQNVFSFKKNKGVSKKIKTIIPDELTIENKIRKAISFVQDDIRYMAIHSGIGSHKPRAPLEVIDQRFGDCKDKSLLLAELLKELGVEASPALVSSILLEEVANYPATGVLFDHCIVTFNYNGSRYWIDPTIQNEGGDFLDHTYCPFKLGLVLESEEPLVKVSGVNPNTEIRIYEYFDISSFEDTCKLDVTTEYYGDRSTIVRSILEFNSLKEIADMNLAFYGAKYPYIQSRGRLEIQDELENNRLISKESFDILNLWKETSSYGFENYFFAYEPISFYETMQPQLCEDKTFKTSFYHSNKYYQITEIKLPDVIHIEDTEMKVNNAAFSYEFNAFAKDSLTLILEIKYESKLDFIAPEDFPEICADINRIFDKIMYTLNYPKTKTLKKPELDLENFLENYKNRNNDENKLIVIPPKSE